MDKIEVEAEIEDGEDGFLQPVPYRIDVDPCRVDAELGRDEYKEATEVDDAE